MSTFKTTHSHKRLVHSCTLLHTRRSPGYTPDIVMFCSIVIVPSDDCGVPLQKQSAPSPTIYHQWPPTWHVFHIPPSQTTERIRYGTCASHATATTQPVSRTVVLLQGRRAWYWYNAPPLSPPQKRSLQIVPLSSQRVLIKFNRVHLESLRDLELRE